MDLDIINPHVLKIVIAAREKDSINAISRRINVSYGWTYKWVQELAKRGVFRLTRMNVYVNEKNELYTKTMRYIRNAFVHHVQFHYEVLSLFGIHYCFTKTDAVFIWTKGGYNIGRYKWYYPIFIKVKKSDQEIFEQYCKKLGLKINTGQGIFLKVEYREDFEVQYCEGVPVQSLQETIAFMEENIYNFEPALEMIKEMYKKKISVHYKEVATNV